MINIKALVSLPLVQPSIVFLKSTDQGSALGDGEQKHLSDSRNALV